MADEAVVALERLDRVALLADLYPLAHDGVEVDQHLAPQELVDLLLTGRVAGRERAQGRALVRRVVVDVQARIVRELLEHEEHEPSQRLPLRVFVVRPQARVAGARPPAPEVLEPTVRERERVTLEV